MKFIKAFLAVVSETRHRLANRRKKYSTKGS